MKAILKFHVFGVVPDKNSGDFLDLLKMIKKDSLEERVRSVGLSSIRVEDVIEKEGLYYFDFSKFREQSGPGKASRKTPVKGFTFGVGESFCEETACLYIPSTKHLIVQYNHHGARVGVIQEYMNSYDDNNSFIFEFMPKYDAETERKFNNRKAVKKLVFSIDPRNLSVSDKEAGTALSQAIDIGKKSNASKVELIISAGTRKGGALHNFIDKTAVALNLKSSDNPDGITKLRVGVVNDLDGKMEVLDLIAQRLVQKFNDAKLGADLRVSRKDRYDYLQKSYNGWKKLLK